MLSMRMKEKMVKLTTPSHVSSITDRIILSFRDGSKAKVSEVLPKPKVGTRYVQNNSAIAIFPICFLLFLYPPTENMFQSRLTAFLPFKNY